MDSTFTNNVREYINILSPLFLIIGALISVIATLWAKTVMQRFSAIESGISDDRKEKSKKEREEEDDCDVCKEKLMLAMKTVNTELLSSFNEGLRKEREFRIEVLKENKADIGRLFERVDEIAITMARIETIQNIYIKLEEERNRK